MITVSAHNNYMQIWEERPIFYRNDCDLTQLASDARAVQQLAMERELARRAFINRLHRIHRVYLPASLTNPKFALTFKTSVDVANEYLDLHLNSRGSVVSSSFWAVPLGLYLSLSAYLLCMAY